MEHLVQYLIPLARGSLLRIEDGRDMAVNVCSGAVWITQEGDRRDRYVATGSSFTITAAGLTLLSALGRSVVELASPRESGFAERIDLVRAGTGNLEPLFVLPGKIGALRARLQSIAHTIFSGKEDHAGKPATS